MHKNKNKNIWKQSKYTFSCQKNIREKAAGKCLSLIILDSVIRVSEKYYPQTPLEECIYEIKKTKIEYLMNDDLDPSLSDNDTDNESDNDTDNESGNDESDE